MPTASPPARSAPAGSPGHCEESSDPRSDRRDGPAPPAGSPAGDTAAGASFIETQFPVSRLSKESYKERKANYSQTLTGLGKWWGRKPLVLVRAVLLGLLMPASGDPRRDRDVFLALLTMDDEGLWRRKRRAVPLREIRRRLSAAERDEWFAPDAGPERLRLRKGVTAADRRRLQRLVFDRLGYDEKLVWCDRPEQVDGPSADAWPAINAHLGTAAASLPELVRELGRRRFGRAPRVGDAFCGGGSVPFEAARLGCEAYGSDLNPVAALLTWGALRIVGGGPEVAGQVRAAQQAVFDAVDRQVTAWGIEHDANGWRADAFLYCAETVCPACGWRVPLAPGWVVGEKTRTVARLRPEPAERRFAIEVRSGVGPDELAAARAAGTVKGSRLECPQCRESTPMAALRGDRRDGGRGSGLRRWENDDLAPRPDDVFGERLYCVRWRLPRLDALLRAEQDARAGRPGSPPPVPEQVGLDRAIAALAGLADAAGRREIAALRARDWPAEERALEEARREFEARSAGRSPQAELDAAARRPREAQATVAGRDARVDALTKATRSAGRGPQAEPDAAARRSREAQATVAGRDARVGAPTKAMRSAGRGPRAELDTAARRPREAQATVAGRDARVGAPTKAMRSAGRGPRAELDTAARRLREAQATVAGRDARVDALTKSLPGALYRAAGDADREREARALDLLRVRFPEWQARGYVPSRTIAPGDETSRLLRERGWTHWHHLFNPRQLLIAGSFIRFLLTEKNLTVIQKRALTLILARCLNFNSRLTRWVDNAANEKGADTFANQALNTLLVYVTRPWPRMATIVKKSPTASQAFESLSSRAMPEKTLGENFAGTTDFDTGAVQPGDARENTWEVDLWVTDPPYADAVNYHELSEFFLAWYEQPWRSLFPNWNSDSRRALAIKGADADFRRGMVASYRNLAEHMPADGLQVVMFTHQDASVWADLTLILWTAGLRVTAAWTIATETESALKEGNYVQGTVLMVLRKQTSAETAFLDEVVPEVETEVERQLDAMLRLDDREAPNFSDADYQLAAYAAALRVLTRYRAVEDVDVARQLARGRRADDGNPIERIIADAVRTASDFLVPRGLPAHLWRRLGPEEKLYLKGLDVERRDEFRAGVYQEFARGFGVRDYRALLRTGKANETRLKTASELGRRELADSAFGRSLVRHALYAVWWTSEHGGDPADSVRWLRAELPDYWPRREGLAAVLRYLAALDAGHWREDAAAARVLAGAVENDHV